MYLKFDFLSKDKSKIISFHHDFIVKVERANLAFIKLYFNVTTL